MEASVLLKLGISLVLGLLVGLERERTGASVAGIRTFALISLMGTICGLLGVQFGGWVVATGLAALAVLLVIGNFARVKGGDIDPGLTTELAATLLYGVGAYLAYGQTGAAVALGGTIALLLHLKNPLHAFVAAIGEKEIKAIMRFVLVTLVILPLLPNEDYGPYGAFNPFKTWLFVVLVVGLSLGGYVIYQFVGGRAGTLLNGILGGLISSTATTVSQARRSAEASMSATWPAALIIMVASTVLYARVLILITVVAFGQFLQLGPPLVVMMAICSFVVAVGFRLAGKHSTRMSQPENPAALKSALMLAGLYALIRLGVAAAKGSFGSGALYAVAVVSGLTDVDAITLSTAQLVNGGGLEAGTGWRIILIASMSNFVFKGGLVAWLGGRGLLREIVWLFGAALLAGAIVLWLWPK